MSALEPPVAVLFGILILLALVCVVLEVWLTAKERRRRQLTDLLRPPRRR